VDSDAGGSGFTDGCVWSAPTFVRINNVGVGLTVGERSAILHLDNKTDADDGPIGIGPVSFWGQTVLRVSVAAVLSTGTHLCISAEG
jgi:hypothetical protein